MKIIRISARCGSPCGAVNLSQLVDGIDLENGRYVLSLRDSVVLPDNAKIEDLIKRFSLGKAKAAVEFSAATSAVNVSVESSEVQDFIDLYDAVCEHLGIESEHLPRPKQRLEDLSFIRGLRNDIAALRRYLGNRLRFNKKAIN